jgi:hypothetical protein
MLAEALAEELEKSSLRSGKGNRREEGGVEVERSNKRINSKPGRR